MRSYIEDLIRKYLCIIIFTSILIMFITILLSSAYNENQQKRIFFAAIEEITIKETPKKGEQAEICLIGSLPNPAFKLHSHMVKIDDYKREVNIKLWQIIYGNACPAVDIPVPFDYSINVKFPLSGNWTISCNNKINISIIVYN